MCVLGTIGGQKAALDPPKLELLMYSTMCMLGIESG